MIEKRICIVGLGLMGGSLALALRGQGATVVGVDRHAATRQMALRNRVVDEVTHDLAAGVRDADVLILATPVRTILSLLAQLPQICPDGCMVLDLGSTKTAIGEAMANLPEAFQAIGGHPMCGKETAGLQAADADLYRGQTFILCRNGRSTPAIEQTALTLIKIIGANPLFLKPDVHDSLVAMVSHVPYLVSALLMHCAADMQDARAWPVSASGFRDASRLSGSDPSMMLDILLTNKTAVLQQIVRYQGMLTAVAQWLADGNEAELTIWLAAAQRQYAAYRQEKDKS